MSESNLQKLIDDVEEYMPNAYTIQRRTQRQYDNLMEKVDRATSTVREHARNLALLRTRADEIWKAHVSEEDYIATVMRARDAQAMLDAAQKKVAQLTRFKDNIHKRLMVAIRAVREAESHVKRIAMIIKDRKIRTESVKVQYKGNMELIESTLRMDALTDLEHNKEYHKQWTAMKNRIDAEERLIPNVEQENSDESDGYESSEDEDDSYID
jgi:cell division septum initiation protein DivIVA